MAENTYTREELEKMDTVMLLSLLNSARAQVSIADRHFSEDCPVSRAISEVVVVPYKKIITELKDILSTREHIPNKQERKLIRASKQKEKQLR